MPAAVESPCVSYNLRKAARIVSKVYAQAMREAPVQGPQYSLMMLISRRERCTISELAEYMGTDRTTMTRNLEQLEKRGFIQIGQGRDQRSKAIVLKPKGKAAIERSVPYWREAQSQVLEALGEQRWQRMRGDLSALSALARE